MSMAAYYNEYDPKAAAWLRELIKQGHIADGVVDERSIEDVIPTELAGFTQCHFFAGIGVWSYALRRAGWADDRPVWTGSCPCQPFSAAGKGAGFDDERHLWPAFHYLISQCQPAIVLGEQVASKDGLGWLDLVLSDLEATGYASGAVDLCAAGIGAPHIRQRLWWVGTRLGDANNLRREGDVLHPLWGGRDRTRADGSITGSSSTGDMGNPNNAGPQGHGKPRDINAPSEWSTAGRYSSQASLDGGLADTDSYGCGAGDRIRSNGQEHDAEYGSSEVGLADSTSIGRVEGVTHDGRLRGGNSAEGPSDRSTINGDLGCGLADTSGIGRGAGGVWDNSRNDGNQPDADVKDGISMADTAGAGQHQRGLRNGREFQQGTREASGERGPQTDCSVGPDENVDMAQRNFPSGPTNGHWRDADWLFCRDGKWRPVEPGTSPLAHGSAARVGRLRGYGNAIVAQAAQAFIESVM
jgi:DNA (cytosine-5)-methyltransferase 1